MKRSIWCILALAVSLMGCSPGAEEVAVGSGSPEDTATDGATADSGDAGLPTETTEGAAADPTADPASQDSVAESEAGAETVSLNPENTDIVFIGTHAPPAQPDPRTCEFTDFTGTAAVAGGALTAVEVTIKTEGIQTFQQRLTDHLRNTDFFNVLEYPEAKFKSTSIEPGEDGKVTITGDLTLLAETKPVTFPATVSTEDGLSLSAEFIIDRTAWGMTARQDGVLKEVTLQIKIGG